MNIPTVIVYSPSGEPERHTRPNARDLVNGAGYTWMKGVPTTPASIAPFVTFDPPDEGHLSQKVLDSRGSSASAANGAASGAAVAQAAETARIKQALADQQAAAAAALVAPTPEVEVKDFSAAPPVDASDLDDPADAEDEAEADDAAPRRRGRPPRAG
jgi:hypothetical protein